MRINKKGKIIKGRVIPKILEILQRQAEATVDLLEVFLSSYPGSYRKAWQGITSGPKPFNTDWAEWYVERQKFFSLLNQLKNQGFVEKTKNPNKKTIWSITKKGLEKLETDKNN